MAATRNRIDETADAAAALSGRFLALMADVDAFIGYNQAQAIDWGGAEKPANLEEDEYGNIQARDFTRQQVSNGIGTFAAMQALLAQGGIGNLRLLAKPKG